MAGMGIDCLLIRRGWHRKPEYQVCADSIRLLDRRGKIGDMFTFGGKLTINAMGSKTKTRLSSPAPILHLTAATPPTVPDLLAAETQVLLAERRAAWTCQNKGEFEQRLVEVDPIVLYRSCIKELKERFRGYPEKENESIMAFKRFLQCEARCLSEEEGSTLHSLADIL